MWALLSVLNRQRKWSFSVGVSKPLERGSPLSWGIDVGTPERLKEAESMSF